MRKKTVLRAALAIAAAFAALTPISTAQARVQLKLCERLAWNECLATTSSDAELAACYEAKRQEYCWYDPDYPITW